MAVDLAVYDAGSMTIVETTRRKTPYAVNWTGIGYRVPMLQTVWPRLAFLLQR